MRTPQVIRTPTPWLVALAIVALALVPAIATDREAGWISSEHARLVTDLDDSPGPLDVVYAGQRATSDTVRFRITTFERWPTSVLGGGYRWLGVFIRTSPSANPYLRSWRKVFVTLEGDGDLRADVYGAGKGGAPDGKRRLGRGRVSRPDAHSVAIVVPQRLLGSDLSSLFWFASSSFETVGPDDEGFPDCNWEHFPPRPTHDWGLCFDVTPSAKFVDP